MTHPQNVVRLRHAAAHMGIVTSRAEAAPELELMRATSIIEQARLDRFKERSRREAEYLGQLQQYVIIEEKKRAMIAGISDPELRASLVKWTHKAGSGDILVNGEPHSRIAIFR